MKTTKSIVAVYEDATARNKAVDFCDSLIKQFWARCEFDVLWCSFSSLDAPVPAKEAAAKAAEADVVVFACAPGSDLPPHITVWIETWSKLRGERGGALASLVDSDPAAAPKHNYLRAVAHRAGMDYLTQLPDEFAFGFPEVLESYHERASHMSGVLEEILRRHPVPRL